MKNFKLVAMSLLTFGIVTATTTFVTQQTIHAHSATTLVQDAHGKWYKPFHQNNRVDNHYTGLVFYNGRWFYVKNGYVDWNFTGIAQNPVNKRWFYVNKGSLDWSFTGIAQNPMNKRWFYINKGALDWNFTGIAQNPMNKRWFYVNKGTLDWNFTGIAQNPRNKRWFYINKGALDWNFTGIAQNPMNKRWFYVNKGTLDWSFTGVAQNPINKAFFYVKKGEVDPSSSATNPEKEKTLNEKANTLNESFKDLHYYSDVIYRAAGYTGRFNTSHLEALQLETSFNRVKNDLNHYLRRMLDKHWENTTEQENYITANKTEILLGLAYLDRWYSIAISPQKQLKDSVLNAVQQSSTDLSHWLATLGSRFGLINEPYLPDNNEHVFKQKIAPYIKTQKIYDFLKHEVTTHQPQLSFNDWFKNTTKAYIVEEQPQSVPMDVKIAERLNQDSLQRMLLPLLTMTSDSLYIIPTTTTITFGDIAAYVDHSLKTTNPEQFKQLKHHFFETVRQHAIYQRDHIDFWYRIAPNNVKSRLLNGSVLIFDSLLRKDRSSSQTWIHKTGENSSDAVREVLVPSGRYHYKSNADAFSDGDLITFSGTRIMDLTEKGGSIWTHELVHALEDKVYLGGHGLRPGVGQESYAEGLFQSIGYRTKDSIGFSLYKTLDTKDLTSYQTVNHGPNRFKNANDLKDYMHNLFDILYVLDIAEANAFLNTKPIISRGHLIGEMKAIKDTTIPHVIDQVDAANGINLRLNSLNDLIENNIVFIRNDFTGAVTITGGPTADRNTYVRIPLFSPMYGLLQNDHGASGGYTFRRTAFELLAHKGFEEGMIPYISDQYASKAKAEGVALSDTYIINQIFKDDPHINNLIDFKKEMFKERQNRLNYLKSVTFTYNNKTYSYQTFNQIEALMKDALKKDASALWNKRSARAIFDLKKAIFIAYLKMTNEFKTSIFNDTP